MCLLHNTLAQRHLQAAVPMANGSGARNDANITVTKPMEAGRTCETAMV
jgi:hypothetical protein